MLHLWWNQIYHMNNNNNNICRGIKSSLIISNFYTLIYMPNYNNFTDEYVFKSLLRLFPTQISEHLCQVEPVPIYSSLICFCLSRPEVYLGPSINDVTQFWTPSPIVTLLSTQTLLLSLENPWPLPPYGYYVIYGRPLNYYFFSPRINVNPFIVIVVIFSKVLCMH